MRYTITGSRDYTNSERDIITVLNMHLNDITEINVGDARGVDAVALAWAHNVGIPWKRYEADWDRYDKAAGNIRNKQMIQDGSRGCIAIWNGKSNGTANCIQEAIAAPNIIRVVVYKILHPVEIHQLRIPCKKS